MFIAILFFVFMIGCFILAALCFAYDKKEQKEIAERQARDEALKKKREEEFLRKHPHYEEEEFYNMCKKNKIRNVSEKANIARLELVAKQLFINKSTDELIEMYKIGQNAVKEAQKDARLSKLGKKEQQFYVSAQKYINYFGREKKIKILSESLDHYTKQLTECKAKIEAIDDGTFTLYELGKGKEADWALLGGIAEGLGGPAAGIATAIDVQNRNAQVRANNEALLKSSVELASSLKKDVYEEQRRAEKQIEYYKKEIEKTEMKLVDDASPEKLLDYLSPTATVEISETGAVKITVETSKTLNLKIYDSVPAVVDGTIRVNVLKNGVKVGEAYATLPLRGSECENTIETICISPKETANNYTVSFEPYKLWAIEK